MASRGSARRRQAQSASALRFEQLEPRVVMSAAGLVPVGAQPTGPLTGKIVYTSAGHGWEWNSNLGRFDPGRVDSLEINEAFGNQDQMTLYADYILRAGGTVVPMRPVGRQLNEVVLDNDSPGVTFSGTWTDSTGSVYYDEDYDVVDDAVHYRSASINANETATATYTPNIPQEGMYPVYTWVADGSNRTNQLYRINHSGGATEIRVDHRLVGKGWVYLGTYHFAQGAAGNVQISNQSAAGGSVVIADTIRFGNGMGDLRESGSGIGTGNTSGYPREDEASLFWTWRAVGQGNNPETVTGGDNISAPSRMAEHMNAAPYSATLSKAVYIGFHSNAAGGRGAVGLIDSSAPTPNQTSLATYTGRQINQDMQALNGVFEHNWGPRTVHTLAAGFGEINEGASAEMDMTIIEVGFHDQAQDAEMLRDPRVRDQIARSTYEATLEYFDNFGGLTTPVTTPSVLTNVRAVSNASGEVTLSWNAGPTGVHGNAATSYRIYASSNGYGFDGGTLVAGGGTTTATLSGYDPTLPYYFKIVAVNAGGESKGSEVMAVVPNGGVQRVLIVNGFDRFERTQNFRYPYIHTGDGLVDRVWSRYNNSFDYAVQMASAIHASAPDVAVSTASNEAVISGAVNLDNYDAVMWILGEESTGTDTFNATEQTKVAAYMAQGGKLFVSGSEIGFDLDASGGGAGFFNNTLKADYVADDAGTYNVAAAAGSIFTGLSFSFSSGAQFSSLTSQTYNVDTPDRINPLGGATAALSYSTGTGAAGIQHTDAGTGSQLVMLAFPFETITTAANRAAVMERVVQYFQLTEEPTEIDIVLDNGDGPGVYTETGSWQTSGLTGYNGTSFRYASPGTNSTAQWRFTAPFAGQAEVFVQYLSSPSRTTNAVYEIDTGTGVQTAGADQTTNSLTWVSLGTYFFQPGERTITLNALLSANANAVNADAVRVVLTAGTEPNGDFDGDGQVDGHDFLTWQRGVGATGATPEQGDANGDGVIDGADLAVWQGQFGPTPPAAAAASAATTEVMSATASESNDADLISLAQFELSSRSLGVSSKPAAIHKEPSLDEFGGAAASAAAIETPTISAFSASVFLTPSTDDDSQASAELADHAIGRLADWSWRQEL
jgi:hypothetical protein